MQSTQNGTGKHAIRADIQGLRGVAVLAVVLYHLLPSAFPNGYFGVDAFFVISGFVITGTLSRNTETQFRDYLLEFFERRIRRLMPSLLVCVTLTCAVGLPLIPPDSAYYSSSWKTGLSSMLGLANVYLQRQALDYFGGSSEYNLFTQMWSLGVEEQFYFCFPFIVWFSRWTRAGGRAGPLVLGLAGGWMCSLIAFVVLDRTNPAASFFLVTSRFWELATGAIACLLYRSESDLQRKLSAVWRNAALFVVVGCFMFPGMTRTTGTVLSVLVTAMLLLLGRENPFSRGLLESSILVYLGTISYSLYLWHWSVISVSRWTVGVRLWSAPIQLLASVLVAHVAFRLVEQPLRRSDWFGSRGRNVGVAFALVGMCTCAVTSAGTILRGHIFLGDEARTSDSLFSQRLQRATTTTANWGPGMEARRAAMEQLARCNMTPHHLSGTAYRPKPEVNAEFLRSCLSASAPAVLLVGDSFAQVIAPQVAWSAREAGREFRVLVGYGCPYPLNTANIAFIRRDSCELNPEDIRTEVVRSLKRGDVLILRVFFGKLQYISYSTQQLERSSSNLMAAYDSELLRLERDVIARGAHLLVIGANPTAENSPVCLSPQWYNGLQQQDCARVRLADSLLSRYSVQHDRHLAELFIARSTVERSSVIAPTQLFCSSSGGFCSLEHDGRFLLSDGTHLQPTAADLLLPQIALSLARWGLK